jgi:hypothetical protein
MGCDMIDVTDTKTVDLLSGAKKRGRPVTGRAMSAAERKRLSRERAREYDADLSSLPVEELLRRAGRHVAKGYDALLAEVLSELLVRCRSVDSGLSRAVYSVSLVSVSDVTVTEKPVEVASVTVTEKPVEVADVTVTKKNKVAYALGEDTWTGRGKRPQWVVDALDRGLTLMDLLIK